jgi:transcriptional regulator with XRE-family HTH domain
VIAKRLADIHRSLRHRLRLTQQEVADAARISRRKVSELENQNLARLRWPEVRLNVEWRGAAIDRLLDEGHARLVGEVVAVLSEFGWLCEVEVTFSEFGDRGSIDVLAWHPIEQALLVVEVKTELGSVDGLLRPLDVKVRLAAGVARDRFGWRDARVIGRVVVLPENSTARRTIERQSAVLGAALPAGSRDVRRWLRKPRGTLRGLWFLSSAKTVNVTRNPSAIRRVRRPTSRAV